MQSSTKDSNYYNYHTNQMCNRCDNYNNDCTGKMREMYMPSINHYCPFFKDKNYGSEQQRVNWHLDEFVKMYNTKK